MEKTIKTNDDLLNMLDAKFRPEKDFWNPFYSDRDRTVPFFKNLPDENLVSYINRGMIAKGKALELGCGPGRNAIYLARSGFQVDAYDISETAIQWAKERTEAEGVSVNFDCRSIFDLHPVEEYELVYDSGCLHHILPHRRIQYLQMIQTALRPGGYFGLTCFRPGFGDIGGPVYDLSDWDVYEQGSMKGGLAFTEEKVRYLLSGAFKCVEFRAMNKVHDQDVFGVPFLWTSLWKKVG